MLTAVGLAICPWWGGATFIAWSLYEFSDGCWNGSTRSPQHLNHHHFYVALGFILLILIPVFQSLFAGLYARLFASRTTVRFTVDHIGIDGTCYPH